MNKNPDIYLPGLNGIRALAALTVILSHIDQFAYLFKIDQIGIYKKNLAGNAVILFFVLSGYLISYLLLIEKNKYGDISYRKFYIRRVLRIWPVYYLAIIIVFGCSIVGFVFETQLREWFHYLFFIFLIPNFAYSFSMTIKGLTPLWSIGVEEQFYAFWPLLINRTKSTFTLLISFIMLYLLIKVSCLIMALHGFVSMSVYVFIYNSCFDAMAIGGIGAYLVIYRKEFLSYLHNRWLQIFSWLFLFYTVLFKSIHVFSLIDSELYSVVFMILIINVSTNSKTILTLENGFLNFIGKISYGMYVYHLIVIYIIAHFIHLPNGFKSIMLLYVIILATTILMAWLSHNYFEKFFIKRKSKYTML